MGEDNISFPAPQVTGMRYFGDSGLLDDLFNRRILVLEDRPPISDGARAMEAAENMKRHRQNSINYSNRGKWQRGTQSPQSNSI